MADQKVRPLSTDPHHRAARTDTSDKFVIPVAPNKNLHKNRDLREGGPRLELVEAWLYDPLIGNKQQLPVEGTQEHQSRGQNHTPIEIHLPSELCQSRQCLQSNRNHRTSRPWRKSYRRKGNAQR